MYDAVIVGARCAGSPTAILIEEWRVDALDGVAVERDLDMLADVLHAVVHDGAGVSFGADARHVDRRQR